jgi:hypothetical protein
VGEVRGVDGLDEVRSFIFYLCALRGGVCIVGDILLLYVHCGMLILRGVEIGQCLVVLIAESS